MTDTSMRALFLAKRAEIDKRQCNRRLEPLPELILKIGLKEATTSTLQQVRLSLALAVAVNAALGPVRRALGRP